MLHKQQIIVVIKSQLIAEMHSAEHTSWRYSSHSPNKQIHLHTWLLLSTYVRVCVFVRLGCWASGHAERQFVTSPCIRVQALLETICLLTRVTLSPLSLAVIVLFLFSSTAGIVSNPPSLSALFGVRRYIFFNY